MRRYFCTKQPIPFKVSDLPSAKYDSVDDHVDNDRFTAEEVHPRTPRLKQKGEKVELTPYDKFLFQKESVAACWRRDPLLDLVHSKDSPVYFDERLSMEQKAKVITDSLTSGFYKWMCNFGGNEKSSLTQEDLIDLFEMGLDVPATRATKVGFQEVPYVCRQVAQETGNLKKSREYGVRSHVARDVKAEKRPGRLTSFGCSLPRQLRWQQPKNNIKQEWLENYGPSDVISMSVIWEGVHNLKSTKKLTKWLERNEIPVPRLLLQPEVKEKRLYKDYVPGCGRIHR